MSETAVAVPAKSVTKAPTADKGLAVQRQCACGQHTVAGGECEGCRKKRLTLQRWDKGYPGPALPAAAAGSMTSRFGVNFTRAQLPGPQPMIQRMSRNEAAAMPEETAVQAAETAPTAVSEPAAPETTPAAPATEPSAPGETAAPGLLVADEAAELGEGQMRKSEFLAELRTAVCAAADAELAAAGRDTQGCPYLDYWFDYYGQREAAHGERALRRFAPEAASAASAREYIPLVAERVRQGVARWASTGEISGVPEGIPLTIPGLSGIGGLFTGIGALFFKARAGGARPDDDPAAIRDRLGHGRGLDSSVRTRMESAFGTSFGHVRLHNDSNAANLSGSQNARAFTVGEHVAFGAGEYQPGTMMGDALIAHELAHVVQQSGSNPTVAPLKAGDSAYNVLEADADKAAVGVMTSLFGGAKGTIKKAAATTIPHLRSGLRLQRCSATRTARTTTPATATPADPCPTRVELESTQDMTPGGLEKGYRTAYGIASLMRLLPDETDWSGAQVFERVTLRSGTCPANWNLCTGGDRPFPINQERYSTILGTLPALRNRFYDFHTSRWNQSRLHDSSQNPTGMDSCTATCQQEYVCNDRTLGRFAITRTFRKDSYNGRDVTVVNTTKTQE